jgi:hypothetical protein
MARQRPAPTITLPLLPIPSSLLAGFVHSRCSQDLTGTLHLASRSGYTAAIKLNGERSTNPLAVFVLAPPLDSQCPHLTTDGPLDFPGYPSFSNSSPPLLIATAKTVDWQHNYERWKERNRERTP